MVAATAASSCPHSGAIYDSCVSTIGVLALQGDVREHVRALASTGAPAVPVRPAAVDRARRRARRSGRVHRGVRAQPVRSDPSSRRWRPTRSNASFIVPSVFDPTLAPAVAEAVRGAAGTGRS